MNNKQTIIFQCSRCQKNNCMDLPENNTHVSCSSCKQETQLKSFLSTYERCPFCECKAFYVQKSIHPQIMWGGLFIAIVLVPWSYGLSLPVLWLIDLAIHKKIPNLLVCYRCRGAFHGFRIPEKFKAFQHWIGDKYEL